MTFFISFWQRLIDPVDRFLDRLTTYRLMLYYLYVLVGAAAVAALFHKVPYRWYEVLLAAGWLVVVCRVANFWLAERFSVPKNKESELITALILALILSPITSPKSALILAAAGTVAMASKYLLVINRWHIFNPAAVGAYAVGATLHAYPSWWVGTAYLTPVVIAGGILIMRKMKRFIMAAVFISLYLAILAFTVYLNQSGSAVPHNLWIALSASPLLFFAYVMFLEPLTSPRYAQNYLPYAVLVASLYGFTKLGVSPEEALLVGNLFTYLVEPNRRVALKFVRKVKEAEGIESFMFSGKQGIKFNPGQYLEWTIPQTNADARGNRRYFTISSSPTEKGLMLTARIPEPSSSFKSHLAHLKKGDEVLAAQLAGTFTLPKSDKQKMAFLAGGVGITPFRSMVKYLLDFDQPRPIELLYSANIPEDLAFRDLFKDAEKVGLRTHYTITDTQESHPGWHGRRGLISKEMIAEVIPDWAERIFYISGPYGFVFATRQTLLSLGVPSRQIKSDYFPGYG